MVAQPNGEKSVSPAVKEFLQNSKSMAAILYSENTFFAETVVIAKCKINIQNTKLNQHTYKYTCSCFKREEIRSKQAIWNITFLGTSLLNIVGLTSQLKA